MAAAENDDPCPNKATKMILAARGRTKRRKAKTNFMVLHRKSKLSGWMYNLVPPCDREPFVCIHSKDWWCSQSFFVRILHIAPIRIS
mmetsp:Transcript_24366/g.56762  ORF Transcript_24366/g.56762 Transcript_24366/m.56762 type:complete len:87 (-) Transcript_24366:43-303(-)